MSAQLSLTLFFMSLPVLLVLLPYWVERQGARFSTNELAHLIIKRSCWILASFLMTLVSAVMLTIANNAGINLSREIIRYLWFFGWGGYLIMFWLAYTTIKDCITLKALKTKQERYGSNE